VKVYIKVKAKVRVMAKVMAKVKAKVNTTFLVPQFVINSQHLESYSNQQ
jgi:hypothetical protein